MRGYSSAATSRHKTVSGKTTPQRTAPAPSTPQKSEPSGNSKSRTNPARESASPGQDNGKRNIIIACVGGTVLVILLMIFLNSGDEKPSMRSGNGEVERDDKIVFSEGDSTALPPPPVKPVAINYINKSDRPPGIAQPPVTKGLLSHYSLHGRIYDLEGNLLKTPQGYVGAVENLVQERDVQHQLATRHWMKSFPQLVTREGNVRYLEFPPNSRMGTREATLRKENLRTQQLTFAFVVGVKRQSVAALAKIVLEGSGKKEDVRIIRMNHQINMIFFDTENEKKQIERASIPLAADRYAAVMGIWDGEAKTQQVFLKYKGNRTEKSFASTPIFEDEFRIRDYEFGNLYRPSGPGAAQPLQMGDILLFDTALNPVEREKILDYLLSAFFQENPAN